MQDQLLGRLWADHHETFASDIGQLAQHGAAAARKSAASIPTPLKVMAAVLAVSLSTITLSGAALASQAAPEAVVVEHADLNLRTREGRTALAARVRSAARILCQPDLAGILREQVERRRCFDAAVAGAQTQLEFAGTAAGARRPVLLVRR